MASPTQLNIVISTSNGATITTSTVIVPISQGLQNLDSSSVASGQTGSSAVDLAVRNIFKAKVFFVPSTNTWYPVTAIQSVTST
ncbi:MAG TPA: hypothetical protein VKP61_15290 [Candidatus Acidoferrum sp.]|nr:hypothetical protein [Candidatus Acidoferrum sp.]